MKNFFLKKKQTSFGSKVLSFFFVFSLVLSSFAPSLVIAQEGVVVEAEQQIVEEQKIVEEVVAEEIVPEVAPEARTGLETVTTETGSITVCKIIIDAEGNVMSGDAGSIFTIPGFTPDPQTSQGPAEGEIPDTVFSTPLILNADLINDNGEANDAMCYTAYTGLNIDGASSATGYYYDEEAITGSDADMWETPLYFDATDLDSISDFLPYNGQLYDDVSGNDEERNKNADGHMVLTSATKDRTLVVLNQMKEEEVNQCLETMSVVSNGSEFIDGDDNSASVLLTTINSVWGSILGANWVWSSNPVANPLIDETKTISKWFEVPGVTQSANLEIFADNTYEVTLNATMVGQDLLEDNYSVGGVNGAPGNGGDSFSIAPVLFSEGGNIMHFEVMNMGLEDSTPETNPAGLIFKLDISYLDNECMGAEDGSTITVTKVVVGGDAEVVDFPLFVNETTVISGVQNDFAPGTYTINEDGNENYIPTFSGACKEDFNNANRIDMIHDWVEKRNALMLSNPNSPNIADINAKIDALLNSITATITLGEDENAECTITNTYTDHTTEYGAYCGDGNIDTSLGETCDGGDSCTDQCQGSNVCSEKAFARVVVPAGSSHIKNFGNGDMTSDVYLGGNTIGNKIPNGTWFMIHDGVNWITDNEALNPNGGAYEDVPGFAVQRGANFVRLAMYSSSPETDPATKEHADGWLEFFNIDTTGLAQVSDGDDNIVEKLNDTIKEYNPGQDELSVSGGLSNFWLTVGPEDDSFKTTFENRVISECGEQGPVCDPNDNLIENGSFEAPLVGASNWDIFAQGTTDLDWLVNWLNPIGAPIIANVEIQKNGIMAGISANDGSQWAELDSDWNGHNEGPDGESGSTKVYQNISTVVGQKYKLQFAHAPRPNTSADENKLRVDWDNTLLAQLDMGMGGASVTWTPETYTDLTATTTSTQVAFSDVGISNSTGTYLDSVGVYCVPEDDSNGGQTCEENPNQEKCNPDEENNGGGGGGGGGSRTNGSVLGDSTNDGTGGGDLAEDQVLGATLAQTGMDVSPMLYLGVIVLGLLVITRRKAFKFN